MSAIVQRKLEHARRRMEEGDIFGTVAICEEVLAQAPRNPEALWLLGMARLTNGDAQAALGPFEQALHAAPTHGLLLDAVGLAYLMLSRFDDAERVLRKAAAAPGAPAIVHMRLGMALTNLGRHEEAAREIEHVLAREPQHLEARVNLGLTYARAGDAAGAEREFMRVLAQVPNHPHAAYNVGVLKLEAGAHAEAESWFRKSVAAVPDYLEARVNLGVSLQRQGRLGEAAAELERAVAQQPQQVAPLNALGQVFAEQGNHSKARECYVQALKLDHRAIAAREGLAVADMALGRHAEAATHLRDIVRVEPENAGAWGALASACFEYGAVDEAATAAARAIALNALEPTAYSTQAQIHYVRGELDRAVEVLQQGYERTRGNHLLGMSTHLLRRLCDWPRWRESREKMRAALEQGADDLGSPYWLLFEDTTPEQQLEYTRRWALKRFRTAALHRPQQQFANPFGVAFSFTRPPSRRLRIGYFSADFHEHPVARLIVEILELHDRAQFEVFAYSHGPEDDSDIRGRIRAAVEHFVDLAHEPDDRAVELVRSHQLDLLVDLRGYTMGDRLQIMAARPARVQATWLGYPGGTGAAFIDYLIADPHIVPAEADAWYAEQVLRMPHSYQPNDRKRPIAAPQSRIEYGLPQEAFVFCCFNQTVKYTPQMFGVWLKLMERVPGSVLWLLEDNAWATANLTDAAKAAGIAPERVVFAPRLAVAQHLARYRVADVALDTFPYGSHTTGSDALWAGCLLVTLRGSTFASRVASSLLTNCGIPELIASSPDEYSEIACRLAIDKDFRSDMRARLERAHDEAPLFDSAQFTRDLEQLYLQIVE